MLLKSFTSFTLAFGGELPLWRFKFPLGLGSALTAGLACLWQKVMIVNGALRLTNDSLMVSDGLAFLNCRLCGVLVYGALFTVIIIIMTITFTSKECQVSVEGQKASSTWFARTLAGKVSLKSKKKNPTSTSMWFEVAYFISRDGDNPSGFLLDCNVCLQGGGFVSNVAPSVAHAWRKCGLKWLTSKAQFRRNSLKTCWFPSLSLYEVISLLLPHENKTTTIWAKTSAPYPRWIVSQCNTILQIQHWKKVKRETDFKQQFLHSTHRMRLRQSEREREGVLF